MEIYWKVIEHYPDGGTWNHRFPSRKTAEQAIKSMQEFHKARVYEIIDPEEQS